MSTVVSRLSFLHAVLGLAISGALVACGPVDKGSEDADGANSILADLPTSETAVRVALFGEGNKAPANSAAMRVWPAWVIVEADSDDLVLDVAGDGAETRLLNLDGVPFPAVDLEFGAPPAAALRTTDDGGRYAQPMALVLDVDVAPDSITRLGDLPGTATLGLSSYLGFVPAGGMSASLQEDGFAEGLNDQTTDTDGAPSKVAFVAVATAGAWFESDDDAAGFVVR